MRDVSDFSNVLSGFRPFNCARSKAKIRGRYSGGITVFVRDLLVENNIVSRIYNAFEDCIVLYFRTTLCGLRKDCILLFVYISPENSPIYHSLNLDGIERLAGYIETVLTTHKNHHLLLCGDFNARMRTFF